VKRLVLLASCGVAAIGLFAILRLRLPQTSNEPATRKRAGWRPNPFLLRFLPSMALWTAVLASFTPFANVYLSRELRIPLVSIGVVFSAVQVVQLVMGLLTPLVFRLFGLINGILATQLATAATLFCLAATRNPRLAIGFYLGFSTLQWMSSPGLNTLLMSSVPDEDRNTASAAMMFSNALLGSASTAIGGALFARHGYPHVLLGIAVLAAFAAVLFRFIAGNARRASSVVLP
jgi:predicted MFS family arabinose efflux permease